MGSCGWCGDRHSILMCSALEGQSNTAASNKTEPTVDEKKPNIKEQNLASLCNLPDVYLQTLRVILYSASDPKGKVVRAIIDSGSQRPYIRSETAERLRYEPTGNIEIAHSLFGGVNAKTQLHNTYLIKARSLDNSYACNFQGLDQDIICADVPSIKRAEWLEELRDENVWLCDLDSSCGSMNDSIDLLIGADIFGKLLTGRKHDLSNGLTIVETRLGWTVTGKVPMCERKDRTMTAISLLVTGSRISDFWDLDLLGIRDPIERSNQILREQTVKENFLKTVSLNENKRYTVDLPWTDDHAPVSRNFVLAKKRLENTVQKLKKDGLYDEYDRVLIEWHNDDIIELVPQEEEAEFFSHYLPHRHVVKPESTTKIRPVFDASASEKGFPSLNQCLEKGPNLIELVTTSLLRFREFNVAVVADIRRAFLQIEINQKDRDFLRFLWFVEGKLRTFRHKRVVFGLTCSPFLLEAVIELHLSNVLRDISEKSNARWSEEIVSKLLKAFYVDNCTTSVASIKELPEFISQAREIMAMGGFDLRGWEFTHDSTGKETTSVLGILFNKVSDTISINPASLKVKPFEVVTKRVILSMAHKIFDPIGSTCPVTLLPKLMLKKLHELKIDWDSPVDETVRLEFLKWYNQLNYLKDIEIPRKFGTGNYELHTFCDASKLAYATATFLRVEDGDRTQLVFIAAKARVAPNKASIPRLELLAAAIASRQTHEIVKALNYDNVPVFLWTDSTTVLAWLNRDLQWGTFVYNRVREIRRLTAAATWRHVPGDANPADLPSRGCHAKQLLDSRWWEGPKWLSDAYKDWPNPSSNIDEDEVRGELKKSAQITMLSATEQDQKIIEKFSSYNKLIRFFAIMVRFKNFKLKLKNSESKRITYQEMLGVELKF